MSALSAGQTKQPLRVILASAGSGKTQRLAELVVSEVSGSSPPGVLAITFTRNAAGELRQRILQVAAQSNPHTLRRSIGLGDTFKELRWQLHQSPLLGQGTECTSILAKEQVCR